MGGGIWRRKREAGEMLPAAVPRWEEGPPPGDLAQRPEPPAQPVLL